MLRMPLIAFGQRWWRYVVAATPDLHLRLAMLLDGLRLVQALQRAVVALVQPPALLHRQPHAVHLVEGDPQGADGALQQRGVGVIETDARGLQFTAGLAGFLPALVGKVDIVPPGEQVGDVPQALAMAQQDEFAGHRWTPRKLIRQAAAGPRSRPRESVRLRRRSRSDDQRSVTA